MEKYDKVIKILTIISLAFTVAYVLTKFADYVATRARKIAEKPCNCNEPGAEGEPPNLQAAVSQ